VAYWNLNHRRIEPISTGYTVNGSPLKFFHYSGFVVEDAEAISKHQNRYTLTKLPHLRPLYEDYRRLLIEHGYFIVKDWPYAYRQFYFDNGIAAPEIIRLIWRVVDQLIPNRWVDPLVTAAPDSLLAWLNQPVDTPPPGQLTITNLALGIYNLRVDLQQAFPEMLHQRRQVYAEWFISSAKRDHELDETFIQPMREALAQCHLAQLTELRAQLADTQHQLTELRAQLADTQHQLADTQHQLADTQHQLDARNQELTAIYGSRAWKIVRKIQQFYQAIVTRGECG
jgi:hypothetical protein